LAFIFVVMRDYLVRSPRWLQWLYPNRIWSLPNDERIVYLTFDDGPHPEITPFVLEELERYQARATFFCIGQNVDRYPLVYRSIIEAGHGVGNHTQHHLNGWKTSTEKYLSDVEEAQKRTESNWFRPPYGRMTGKQAIALQNRFPEMKIAMWDVLSGDFDRSRKGEWCARQVQQNVRSGSVVVMHDSEKAWDRLRVCLPLILEYFNNHGFRLEKLPG